MIVRFLWLLLVIPLCEIAMFLWVGRRIGVLPTLVLILASAVVGIVLIRWQGLATLRRAQQSLARGVLPAQEIVDGMLILGAGLLMLTPGFLTDAVGFLLLLPPTRAPFRLWLMSRLRLQVRSQQPPRASEMEIVDRTPPGDDDRRLR